MTAMVYAQEKPYTQPGTALPVPPPPPPKTAATGDQKPATPPAAPEPNPVDKFFNGKIPEAIAKGKFSLNARLRYEWVDQSTFNEEANAPTIRTRFGYTTAPLYGFQGMIEGENITVIGSEQNYNAAGSNRTADRPIVADPPTTELNQAWGSYTYTNWITARGGRQRLVLDNHRFIGDVGWRQNMQTFDAATVESKPLPGLSLFYGYLWEVNRVFGDVEGLPRTSANRDFDSDSHLVNIAYSGCKFARFVGYTYLLDLENRAGTANS
ncbi:MAG TPA: alginate export family protein, partial [Methylomirabilota bacterium]|nr:alginate export family protein [Methylomirabilota bacterium]